MNFKDGQVMLWSDTGLGEASTTLEEFNRLALDAQGRLDCHSLTASSSGAVDVSAVCRWSFRILTRSDVPVLPRIME